MHICVCIYVELHKTQNHLYIILILNCLFPICFMQMAYWNAATELNRNSQESKKKNPPWKRREWALGSSLPRELRRTPALQLLLWSLLLRHCCWLYPACTQLVSAKLLLKKWLEPSCVCPCLQLISTHTGGKQEHSSMAAFIAASSSTLRDALCEKLWFHSAFCVLRIRKGRFLQ